MKKYNLFDFFSKPKEEIQDSTPADYCPNCWGEQEYDHKIRQLHQDKQIEVNNHEANHAFIQDFVVNKINGIRLIRTIDKMECPTCHLKK